MNQHAKFVREMEIASILFGISSRQEANAFITTTLGCARCRCVLLVPCSTARCTHHRSPWQPLRLRQQPQAHSVQQRHSSLPSARRRRPGVHFDHPLAATPNRHVPCASTTRFLPHISSRLEGIGHICFSFFFHLLAIRSRCKLLNS